MRELSLFSGAGGGLLGTHLLGWRPVGYVEWDDYCQRVIAARIRDGILPDAPIFGDVHSFLSEGYAASYTGMVDIVTGGFPCQPFSLAGKRQGAADKRNGWPATIECIRVVRPRFALLENVPGLLTSGYFGTILGDLAASGFDCRWRVLSAAEMGAPHKRDRLWIVAHNDSNRCWQRANQHQCITKSDSAPYTGKTGENVADTTSFSQREPTDETNTITGAGQARNELGDSGQPANAFSTRLAQRERTPRKRAQSTVTGGDWWTVEPDVGRVANGVASRVDRLKALGNGQVPAVVRAAWMLLGDT